MTKTIELYGSEVIILGMIITISIIFYSNRFKLEKVLSAPFFFIFSLYCTLILGLIYWAMFTGKNYGDLIYLLTLIVVSLYTYYTLQVVKFAYKGPALLHVQERHSDVLKSFLNSWSSSIQHISLESRVTHSSHGGDFYLSKIKKYRSWEERWEYRDLIDYHLPANHKDLEVHWNRFIESVKRLGDAANKLYGSIADEMNQELEKVKIEYPSIELAEPKVRAELYDVIYLKYINEHDNNIKLEIEETREYYYESIGDTDEFVENSWPLYQLMFSSSHNNGTLLSSPIFKEIEFAEAQINKILLVGCMERKHEKHATIIAKVIDHEAEMERRKDEFYNEINELAKRPLLPGTSCNWIKDFDIKL